jgi:tryptophan 7-halogenase
MTALSRIQQVQKQARKASTATHHAIGHVLIVGGGSAGWMTAAALSNVLGPACRITLVESEAIGTVGVGEATIPTIRLLNQTMGVDEKTFLKDTQGTFKLGIEFVNWGRNDHRYFHPFGFFGRPFDAMPVHQHWLKHRHEPGTGTLDDYALAWQAARQGRFCFPTLNPQLLTSTFNYAFHFDASLYAQHLRGLSLGRGVQRIEGTITQVHQHPESGFVTGVLLDNGQSIQADFFIDCSGFRSLLLGEALGVGYDDWSQWLPCDRAVAMPCALEGPPAPYTRSTALSAGWQWAIPLQHRMGNGHVFSTSFISEDQATEALQSQLPGPALGSPRLLKFTPGRRQKAWEKNVLALGLATGFLEPLESTSLHLVHSGITTLLSLFPDKHCHEAVRGEYNRRFAIEMERIRDFIILHYKLTERDDSEMWRYCAHMTVPQSLQERLTLFKHGGHVQIDNYDLFGAESWLAVHLGQLNFPDNNAPLLDMRHIDGRQGLAQLRHEIAKLAQAMPMHQTALQRYLA